MSKKQEMNKTFPVSLYTPDHGASEPLLLLVALTPPPLCSVHPAPQQNHREGEFLQGPTLTGLPVPHHVFLTSDDKTCVPTLLELNLLLPVIA